MESASEVDLGQRVSMLYSTVSGQPIGTCFNFKRPGLLLTAAHTLGRDDTPGTLHVLRPGGEVLQVVRVIRHSLLDLAALRVFPGRSELPCFQAGLLPSGQDYPDEEPVRLYAYTVLGPGRVEVSHSTGCILQHVERYGSDDTPYVNYELTFRGYHGNSGGPVFRERNRHEVVAVATGGVAVPQPGRAEKVHRAVAQPLLHALDWLQSI